MNSNANIDIQIQPNIQLRATLLVALSGILYGFMGYLGTQLFREHFTVSNMLFWRFFVAMIWIVLTLLFFNKNIRNDSYQRSVLLKTILLGTLTYSGTSAFYFLATQSLGTGLAMVVFFSYPVFIVLFAWLLTSWRMNRYVLISLIAIFFGVMLLKGNGSFALSITGLFFAMLSAISYAIYVYGSRHSSKQIDPRLITLLICMGNSIVFFLVSYFTKGFSLPHSLHACIYIVALGIFATALPIQLLLEGMKHISPIKASILSVLEPVVTVIVGFLLLSESMSLPQLIGIIIVLAGAIFIQFERQQVE